MEREVSIADDSTITKPGEQGTCPSLVTSLIPNPPKDGITAGERGMRNLGRAIGRTRFRQVEPERPAVALWGVPAAVCIAARDGMAVMERSGGHSRTVVARVGGDVGLAG